MLLTENVNHVLLHVDSVTKTVPEKNVAPSVTNVTTQLI
jgi:hypothetical protein